MLEEICPRSDPDIAHMRYYLGHIQGRLITGLYKGPFRVPQLIYGDAHLASVGPTAAAGEAVTDARKESLKIYKDRK